jgi:hypothetical protein
MIHLDSQINLRSAVTEVVGEDAFISGTISVTTDAEGLSYGDVVSPGTIFLANLDSSDDLEVSIDGGSNYPFRLKANQGTIFRLNSEALVETQTVQAVADVSGSLHDTYFDLNDRNGPVRVWNSQAAGFPEISTVQTVADTANSLDGTYFILYDDVGSVGVWIDVGDSGTAAPAGATAADRQIEITTISTNDTADQVAAAIQLALDADSKFAASVSTDTVTITNAANGNVTDIAAGDTGFTVATTQQGASVATAPAIPASGRLVQVDIAINATANTIATAIGTAFAADAEISASVATNTVTLTDKHPGARTDIVDVDTGFTVATTQQGAARPDVQIKSAGTSTVLYGVAPF